jgi:hypothetical protein
LLFASSNAICSSTFHLKTSKYKKNWHQNKLLYTKFNCYFTKLLIVLFLVETG